ncbi:aldehyde dehydrogenase (NADP(+)) [Saccharopolyspora sp. WRP15-2]|uniref:Aldehyde dehydrogenase (NADP(+)) n=1 Tax=Saccharopolyspora oryzae TaxID=2997343 RepID=A0ABT4VAM9_9PSEU|nr:aldehyde dehydrogenase (NADP(+)) [Saccharopolyspora oryzae]MDA3630888.1 aldehyde dehydrogenase (NADP(+)) [Saccharopolyspora oryzae]
MTGATSPQELAHKLDAASGAFERWSRLQPADRAPALEAIASALEEAAPKLVAIADEETALGEPRLNGEVVRTAFQLRLFAQAVTRGEYLGATIDRADPEWPMGARPDLRRVLEPLGPVLVFSASNFPFAFSVAGGDTASALAAGCSVVVKAHSGHPRLSAATAEVVQQALESVGAPDGLFDVIFGTDAGRTAIADPRVKAGAFTGSIEAGRALFDIATGRPEPIPFFGELGSVNPVFVTKGAAERRGPAIVSEFVGSFTLGAGQFCTKPGILLVPAGAGLADQLPGAVPDKPLTLLNDRVRTSYASTLDELRNTAGVHVLASGGPTSPTVLRTTSAELLGSPEAYLREVFGPATLVVEYTDESELLEVAEVVDGQLTATIQGEDDDEIAGELIELLAAKAGRVLWNQWPTGVSVTYAQQHGGPYPATTAPATTSVGTEAIYRFLRPVAYQNVPQHLLPPALRDANPMGIPQRIS